MSTKRKGKSCYARHNKAPYRYSEAYRRWADASSDEERARADIAFRRLFGIPTWDIDTITGRVRNFRHVVRTMGVLAT